MKAAEKYGQIQIKSGVKTIKMTEAIATIVH